MSAVSYMRCMDCGDQVDLYGATKFTCDCGGLYDVCHFAEDNPMNWLRRFDDRSATGSLLAASQRHLSPLYNSGVWRFHELIMPSLPVEDIVSLGEGILPFWQAGNNLRRWVGGNLDLWIIPEGLTPTGSFKDFGGTVAMSVAKKSGVKAVICASTGDISAMAAAYAAKAGITCVVVLPKGKVTPVQLAQPIAHWAKVVVTPGTFDDCMRIVRELVDTGRTFPINSLNPTRIEGHQATVFLAAQFFGWELPDAFVVPVGNGSNSSSIGKGMRTLYNKRLVNDVGTKLIGAQSLAANPLAKTWEMSQHENVADPDLWKRLYKPFDSIGVTTATAALIGNPVSYRKVMREINASRGAVLTAQENELNEAVLVAGSDGHFVCPQTGTALAGLRQSVERGIIKPGQRVVVVSTATGLKFPDVPVQFSKNACIESKTCETAEIADIIGV